MKFEIVGAGAIGLLLACKLALAGDKVRIWTRTQEQADLINLQGLSFGVDGESAMEIKNNVTAEYWSKDKVDKVHNEATARADFILLTVKQRALTQDFCELLSGLWDGKTAIICFQNGMGHLERLSHWIPAEHLFAAVTTEGAKRRDSHSVIHAGHGQTLLGAMLESHDGLLGKLAECLQFAGFKSSVSKNIFIEMYRKLLVNAAINPLTALWRIPNGGLLATPLRREQLNLLINEGNSVYRALGIPIEADIAEQIADICRATAGNISSMLADVLKNEPSEIDHINGYLIDLAHKANVAVPTHEMIFKLVKGLREDE